MRISGVLATLLLAAASVSCSEKESPPSAVAKTKDVLPASAHTKELPQSIDAGAKELPLEFKVALTKGRQLVQKGEFPEAISSLEHALDLVPSEPRALSELAWATYHVGDLQRAREQCKQAIAASVTSKHKAAALYTLGRIEEARGELAAARVAYQNSLALRPRKQVKERIESLGTLRKPATEASMSVLGPFAQIREFCSHYAADSILSKTYPGKVACDPRPRLVLREPVGEILSSLVFEMRVSQVKNPAKAIQLALQTEEGWYVALDVATYMKRKVSLRDDNASLQKEEAGTGLRFVFPGPRGKSRGAVVCEVTATSRPSCHRDVEQPGD